MPSPRLIRRAGWQQYRYNGKERDTLTGWYDYSARWAIMEIGGRFVSIDPLADKMPQWSPYSYGFDNPVMFVDPDGRAPGPPNDYYINSNGTIEVTQTNDRFDRFYLKNSGFSGQDQHLSLVGQFDKNEHGLIQLPSTFSFSNQDYGSSFSFNLKKGNEYRSFIHGDAFASLIGALSITNTKDLTIIGFSLSDGSTPDPSTSHVDGVNGDLRYLSTDFSGGRVLLGQKKFDINRQNAFNDALFSFGWTGMLSETFTPHGQNESTLLNHTRHYSKSRHHNHLHLGGYNPNILVNANLPTVTVKPK